jgi:hypothetical protein
VAICSGVTGTCGLRPTVSPAPVMAQVMKAFQFNGSLPPLIPVRPGHVSECPRSTRRTGDVTVPAADPTPVSPPPLPAEAVTDRPGSRADA